jgi:RNA polymerase sigma-70 factor (ECF subfamily)
MRAQSSSDELRKLYETAGPAAFRRASRLLQNEADAWDVVQEVFQKILETSVPRSGTGMAFCYVAVTNLCLNRFKMAGVRRRLQPAASSGQADAAGTAVARDLIERLDSRLDGLDRRLIVFAYMDEMSHEEIAAATGVSRKTVGRRLEKIKKLALALAEPEPV